MRRVLLKLSGEALMGSGTQGIDPHVVESIAQDIASVKRMGIEVAIVIGGGNIFRGVSGAAQGIDRATGDYMGMLGTMINSIALQHSLEQCGISTCVLSAIDMHTIAESYTKRDALKYLELGKVVIVGCGMGNPFFTTDTAAVLRASEMNCDVLLKGTKVHGVFSDDPKIAQDAQHYDKITYREIIDKDLKVMDMTAVALAKENKMPIIVFCIHDKGAMKKIICAREGQYTLVS
jgi:uridylate kinase